MLPKEGGREAWDVDADNILFLSDWFHGVDHTAAWSSCHASSLSFSAIDCMQKGCTLQTEDVQSLLSADVRFETNWICCGTEGIIQRTEACCDAEGRLDAAWQGLLCHIAEAHI